MREEVLTIEMPELLVEQVDMREVLLASAPQGVPGPPGQAGVSYLTFTANGNLGGHRYVVPTFGGAVAYADNMHAEHANAVIGITMGAAADGEQVMVQTSGQMSEPGWNWDADKPVFLHTNGLMSQDPPTTGFSLVVGVPTAPQTLLVDIKQPFLLEN